MMKETKRTIKYYPVKRDLRRNPELNKENKKRDENE